MCNTPEKKGIISQIHISTPERKKEYVKRWLEQNSFLDACSTIDSNELIPDVSCASSNQCQKQLLASTPPPSPGFGDKRTASSPVFGGLRRSFKRMKMRSKIDKLPENKPSCSKSILKEKYSKENLDLQKDCNSYVLNKTQIIDYQDLFHISATSNDDRPNILHDNAKQQIGPHSTQFIETISSDHENTEPRVQEAASDTDKTASDLVEEINSELIYESPQKSKQTFLSQKISTPSSTSSEQTDNNHITESNTRDQTDPQSTEIFTPADQIDTISTIESKAESSKIPYILQHTLERTSKKKNPKKGSLSELLVKTMGKEKSSVTLLRHQLYRNPLSISEMPFVLLQIVHYFPSFNGNQFLQCVLIEDTANLLKNLVVKKTNIITVINVPELSSMINVNLKPVLKVYEPWTVVDPNQLLFHITRFIAIPSSKENFNFYNVDQKVLKLIEEFHCPCIDNNTTSNECNYKFCNSEKSSVKIISNYLS